LEREIWGSIQFMECDKNKVWEGREGKQKYFPKIIDEVDSLCKSREEKFTSCPNSTAFRKVK
jgi:hypothetical protein